MTNQLPPTDAGGSPPRTGDRSTLFIQAAQMKCPGAARLSAAFPRGRSRDPPNPYNDVNDKSRAHVKNLSWNISSCQFAAPWRLKLVPKYCYKCVESKQLETNERGDRQPESSSGGPQFMPHVKDEGCKDSQLSYLNTQIVDGEMCTSYEWMPKDIYFGEKKTHIVWHQTVVGNIYFWILQGEGFQ